MRVLFVSNFYPPYELGGWEQNCREIVERFRQRGHICAVLTSRHGGSRHSPDEAGVSRALHLEADIAYYRPLSFLLHRARQERTNRHEVRAAIGAFRPDLVFIWGMWNLSRQVAFWAEQAMPGRVAYAIAGYWPMEPNAHEEYWQLPANHRLAEALKAPLRRIALHALRRERMRHPLAMEHAACVSSYVRQKLAEAGTLPHGARVIYNGIDPQPFLEAAARRTERHDGLRLVYVGNVAFNKGTHTAIEALGLLRQQRKLEGLSLTLIGGGHPDYVAQLRQRVHELELDGCVSFRGRLPRSEIAGILAEHDVFLFTSVYEEPIARSVMEAMASGLAVIGTAVGGQAEMLEDGVNALVYAADDASALAYTIGRLRGDASLRAQLSEAGQRTVIERFTLDRMAEEMETFLLAALV